MPFLKLTSDFLFKTLFTQNPDLLVSLVNSILHLKSDKKLISLDILNPEIQKEILSDKLSVLDIKARDETGNIFHIEMQAFPQDFYSKRAAYYWAKLYFRQLNQGDLYSSLKKVYSINLLNFTVVPQKKRYHYTFLSLDKYDPQIKLTDDFEVHILELPRFKKDLENIQSDLETWLYVIKKSRRLKETDMKALVEKNPILEKAFVELDKLSMDAKTRELYEMREIGLHDYNTNIQSAFEKGEKRGIKEGIEKGKKRGDRKRTIRTAIELKKAGMNLDFISKITKLPIPWLEKFFQKVRIENITNGGNLSA
ncbi:MAG: Rpn family recombination-promoting nuclease/putative transposase [Leptospiraceae bacterium]|nr:Rpn family recombination-promoting nuclease/putative transposase [Leptospiraceae bacterium]